MCYCQIFGPSVAFYGLKIMKYKLYLKSRGAVSCRVLNFVVDNPAMEDTSEKVLG